MFSYLTFQVDHHAKNSKKYWVIYGDVWLRLCHKLLHKSITCMNIIKWSWYEAEYGLHTFKDPNLLWFQTNHILEHSMVHIMETLETIVPLLDIHTLKKLRHDPYPSWEKMQVLQNYCNNFCKILQENALTLKNSCKIFARVVVFFAKFLQELYSVWTNLFQNVFVIGLKESDTYVSKFRVFLHKNVKGILQSTQNQAFRVGSENRHEWSYPKGRDNNFGKKLFHFVFLFRQIKPLKNIWFQKILYSLCF